MLDKHTKLCYNRCVYRRDMASACKNDYKRNTMNVLKQKIKEKLPICGTHVQLADSEICSIYGQLGYDYIWLDMEHTYLSYRDVLNSLNAARLNGTPVAVRVPQDDLTALKKVLEMGPEGIIFPMVNNAEDANRLIGYTLYPPYGTRGFGPMRAVNYGGEDTDAYVREGHLNMCRFIQIEHRTAIENLEEIVKNPYIDGYIFGPCDLSNSVGGDLKVFEGETHQWLMRAIEILKAHEKYIGISYGDTSPEAISHWHEMGIDMISVGSDYGYLLAEGRRTLKNLKQCHTEIH